MFASTRSTFRSIKTPRDASVASMGRTQDLGATWSSFDTARTSLPEATLTTPPCRIHAAFPALSPASKPTQVYKEARNAVLSAKPKEVEQMRIERLKELNASLSDLPK